MTNYSSAGTPSRCEWTKQRSRALANDESARLRGCLAKMLQARRRTGTSEAILLYLKFRLSSWSSTAGRRAERFLIFPNAASAAPHSAPLFIWVSETRVIRAPEPSRTRVQIPKERSKNDIVRDRFLRRGECAGHEAPRGVVAADTSDVSIDI